MSEQDPHGPEGFSRKRTIDGWLASPRVGPSPPTFRHWIIRRYAETLGLDIFIESGTCYGDTVAAVGDLFLAVYTIELAPILYERAVARFADKPNVHCMAGDTTVVLPDLLAGLARPALLWLDGHWSMADTARGDKETPIVAELEAVLARPERHVILVDDARCFSGAMHDCDRIHEDYPSLAWVRDRALAAGYTYELADDVVRLVHASVRWPGYAAEREQTIRALVGERLTGIIHVGAGLGEEAPAYAALGVPVTWVEANPKLVSGLAWVTRDYGQQVIGAACADRVGSAVLNETEDYRCSSLLHVNEPTTPIEVTTVTLDLLNLPGNLLVVDVQGAESIVLDGAAETLRRVDFVIVEIPDRSSYPTADPDVERYLDDFDAVAEVDGDRLYARRA